MIWYILVPVQAEVESSFEVIKDIRFIAKAALLKNADNDASVLDSKVDMPIIAC